MKKYEAERDVKNYPEKAAININVNSQYNLPPALTARPNTITTQYINCQPSNLGMSYALNPMGNLPTLYGQATNVHLTPGSVGYMIHANPFRPFQLVQ